MEGVGGCTGGSRSPCRTDVGCAASTSRHKAHETTLHFTTHALVLIALSPLSLSAAASGTPPNMRLKLAALVLVLE